MLVKHPTDLCNMHIVTDRLVTSYPNSKPVCLYLKGDGDAQLLAEVRLCLSKDDYTPITCPRPPDGNCSNTGAVPAAGDCHYCGHGDTLTLLPFTRR